jgi:hypothetical protein
MWKHIVDKYLLSPVAKAVTFFTNYLELIAPALPAISYIGYRAPPELFPNAAFHFPIHRGWPLKPDWLSEFQIAQFISPQAALWAPSIVDIQSTGVVVPALQTQPTISSTRLSSQTLFGNLPPGLKHQRPPRNPLASNQLLLHPHKHHHYQVQS